MYILYELRSRQGNIFGSKEMYAIMAEPSFQITRISLSVLDEALCICYMSRT